MSFIGLKKIKYLGFITSVALVAVGCLVLFGCSSQTGPDQTARYQTGDVVTDPVFVQILAAEPSGPQLAPAIEQTIGAAGGSISNGIVTLDFPAGALDDDEVITIRMSGNNLLISDLGPDGIDFNEPVIMSMDLKGTSAEGQAKTTYIAWYDPEENEWVIVENLSPRGPNKVRALLRHFSKYGGIVG
jgi:hypothetical protein